MRTNFTRITRNRQYKKKKREKKKKKYKVGVSYWKVNEGQGESRGFCADVLAAAGATRATALGFQLL